MTKPTLEELATKLNREPAPACDGELASEEGVCPNGHVWDRQREILRGGNYLPFGVTQGIYECPTCHWMPPEFAGLKKEAGSETC